MCAGNADVHDDRPVRHLGHDRAHPVFGQSLGERCLAALEVVGLDEIDAKARQIARRCRAFDVDRRDAELEQTAGQLLFDHGDGADLNVLDDERVRRDAGREAIAVLDGLERFVTRHHRVHAQRAGRRIGVELADGAGEELECALDRGQVHGTGTSLRGRLLVRQALSVIDRRA